MRIIAGSAKGRTLKSIKGQETRPTLGQVRAAVFNVLGTKIINARFLDLFAGSGAIGLEALSRGAACCYFNDKNKAACLIIQDNLDKCAFKQPALVSTADSLQFISYLKKKDIVSFDIIYLDPPYNVDLYLIILKRLLEAKLLASEGMIVVETDKKLFLQEEIQGEGQLARLLKKKKYGDTVIWFYKLGECDKHGNYEFTRGV